jgi:hypothetical protein
VKPEVFDVYFDCFAGSDWTDIGQPTRLAFEGSDLE